MEARNRDGETPLPLPQPNNPPLHSSIGLYRTEQRAACSRMRPPAKARPRRHGRLNHRSKSNPLLPKLPPHQTLLPPHHPQKLPQTPRRPSPTSFHTLPAKCGSNPIRSTTGCRPSKTKNSTPNEWNASASPPSWKAAPTRPKQKAAHSAQPSKEGRTHRDEAIVRIVCFPALSTYRRHGGALAAHQLHPEEREELETHPANVRVTYSRDPHFATNLTGNEGYRTRILGLPVVHLPWGKQRIVTK